MKKLSFFLFLILLSCSSNEAPVKEIDWSKEKSMELYQKILEKYPASIHSADARKRFRQLRGDNL